MPDSPAVPEKPNVVIITSHDTGRHFGCYGVDSVQSPSIDSLAADANLFTNCFTTSPVCSPSRGALLTGRYPQSNGLMGLTHTPWEWTLNPDERHLSHILRDAGYHTALFGIQHESPDVGTLGFAETHETAADGTKKRTADDVAGAFEQFLGDRSDQSPPFYAQIGFFETHRPFDFGGSVPDRSKGVEVPPYLVANEAATADLAELQGSIQQLDRAMGRIVSALERSGHADNTVLIFTTDHGIEFPRAKWYVYDPGIQITLIVRWPDGGIRGGRKHDAFLSNIDVLPTLLELIDVPAPENVEGVSFADVFNHGNPTRPREEIFAMFQGREHRCIRTDRYKLIRNFVPWRRFEVPIDVSNPIQRVKLPVVELYDLDRDPNEFEDVAERPDYASVRNDLGDRLWQWMEAVDDPLLHGPTPTPYYLEAMEDYRDGAMRAAPASTFH